MNRATGFSWASNQFLRRAPGGTLIDSNSVETFNAQWNTRIYMNQAKIVFRHLELRWFLKQPRDVKRVLALPTRFAC